LEDKQKQQLLRAVRRGLALGLALTGLWGVGVTADVSALGDSLRTLGERDGLALSILTARLGPLPGEQALTGRSRLLLESSALLAAGEEPILRLRAQRGQEEPVLPQEPVEDGDDLEQPQLQEPEEDDGVVEMTAQGKNEGKYLYADGIYLYNRTDYDLTAQVMGEGKVDVELGDGPEILIIHTHGSEAYSQTDGDTYEESDPYRTTDCTHNVVKVGEEMATVFRAHGFRVLHDTTLHDYPTYSGAYDRSRAAVEQWLEEYPTISVVLDVHRDALVGSGGEVYKLVSTEAGKKVAQVMLVVGTPAGGAAHPRWKDNLALAAELQKGVERGYDSLARPIVLRNSRYNQDLRPGALLVEVGGHGNTLSEAIAGGRLWADNVARTLLARKGS